MSLVRLTREEIFARLFLLFYAPQFIWFALRYFFTVIPGDEGLSGWIATIVGLALVFAVVLRDAAEARLPAVPWALLALVPFIGWFFYARARAPKSVGSTSARGWSAGTIFNIFASERFTLVTQLTPHECTNRLRSRVVSVFSPFGWLTSSAERPFSGRISDDRFALKIRHPMTRPSMLDEARGRLRAGSRGTAIDLRIGVSLWDRGFAIVWVAFVLLWSGLFFGATRSVPPNGTQPGEIALVPVGMIAFLVLIIGLVRWIGRGDRDRLLDTLTRELDAREDGSGA